jgi:hypothetical protein
MTFAFDADGATLWSPSANGLFGIMSYVEMDTIVGITDATGVKKSELSMRGRCQRQRAQKLCGPRLQRPRQRASQLLKLQHCAVLTLQSRASSSRATAAKAAVPSPQRCAACWSLSNPGCASSWWMLSAPTVLTMLPPAPAPTCASCRPRPAPRRAGAVRSLAFTGPPTSALWPSRPPSSPKSTSRPPAAVPTPWLPRPSHRPSSPSQSPALPQRATSQVAGLRQLGCAHSTDGTVEHAAVAFITSCSTSQNWLLP